MLSRTADSLFWLSRYMERAGRSPRERGAAHNTAVRASARGVFGQKELNDAF
jgi:uncharacterized alpha-E superfamily protein